MLLAVNSPNLSVTLPTVSRVPPELVDHIIDYLHADKATLSVLSSVCHHFLPTASLHLFHSISIDIGRKSLQKLEEFLRQAPPRVLSNVKKLIVTGSPQIVSLFGRTSRQKLSIAALASLLPHIPNLSELCISSVNIEGTLALEGITSRTLNRLSISCVRANGGPVDICILLTLFSDVRTLRIEDTTWLQIRPDPDGAVRQIDLIQNHHPSLFPTTNISSLEMSAALYTRSFLEILRRTMTSASLRRVDVECSSMLELWSLGDFLGHAGRNVEHITFNITRLYEGEIPEIADHVRKCLSLAPSCPVLKTLTLRLNLDPLNSWITSAMFVIVPCLISHAPASLRKVVVELDLPLSREGPRRTREERDIIHFVDKEMTVEWLHLELTAQTFKIKDIQIVWRTGPVHSPDVAELLTSIVRKKVPKLALGFSSCASYTMLDM